MTPTPLLLQEAPPELAAGGALVIFMFMCVCYGSVILLSIAMVILQIAGQWAVFEKAGKPGWAAIIPIYNVIVLAEVARRDVWYGVLVLIPAVGIAFYVILLLDVARLFGKDSLYAIGLLFLPMIFWPMLGYGSARYLGNGGPAMPYGPSGGQPQGGGWGQPPKQTWR